MSKTTIHSGGITFRPFEAIRETGQTIRNFDDRVMLSNFIRGLIEKGVVNFDVISNQTLCTMILCEFTTEQIKTSTKGWDFKESASKSDDDKGEID